MADNPINELAAIPFGHLIGGPLTAAIEAQAQSAMTTVDFINAVAFQDVKSGELRNVKFQYKNGQSGVTPQVRELDVPLLTMLPIPFLRIDSMDIRFKASLSASTETKLADSVSTASAASFSGSASYLFFSAKMSGAISSKKDSSSTRDSRYAVEYTMDINVHAVQDDIPAGLAKVLNLLNESLEARQPEPASNGHKSPERA